MVGPRAVDRARAGGFGALGTDPWRRAPMLLLRHPGVFAACVLASAVLSLAAAAGSLFVASVGTAALHDEASQQCPESAYPAISDQTGPARYATPAQGAGRLTGNDRVVRAALAGQGLPAPDLVAQASVKAPGGDVTLFARASARAHVSALATRPGPGVWVPRSYARAEGLRAGGQLLLNHTRVPVTGVYRDIAPSAFDPAYRLPRYWCTWSAQIVPSLEAQPPPLLLVDVGTLRSVGSPVEATWFVPEPVARLTVPHLRAASEATVAAAARLPAADFAPLTNASSLIDLVTRERDGVAGAITPIVLAAVGVAGLLVGVAAGFWTIRRRRELRVLSSRGVSGAALGGKGALETAPALIAGAALGYLGALGLVRWQGPSSLLDPSGPAHALLADVGALAGALAIVAAVGSVSAPHGRSRPRSTLWRRIPWELTLVIASLVAYWDVHRHGAITLSGATIQVRPTVLAFPLLAIPGALLLAGRVLHGAAGRLTTRARRLPHAAFFAVHRIASGSAVAVGAVIGIALPIAVLLYSYALAGSTTSDVPRKYETNVGADYALGTLAAPGSTPTLGHAGTVVSVIESAEVNGGVAATVLGVDPATFGDFAFPVVALQPLLDGLRGPRGSDPRAILVNAPGELHVRSVRVGAVRVPVDVVTRSAVFPGVRNTYQPMIVLDRAALPALARDANRTEEVWTDDDHLAAAVAALKRDRVDIGYQITPTTFLSGTRLRPITWILGFLRATAYLIGLVALSGLVFVFTARTRRTALSYQLARRMGLSRGGHRRALLTELGVVLGTSWLAGVIVALLAVLVVYRLADPYPTFPPPPTRPLPLAAAGVAAAGCAGLAFLGALALQALLDRSRPAELLRAA